MGKLRENLGTAPRTQRIVALAIDPDALTASAVMREGVEIDDGFVATAPDQRVEVPAELAAVQLSSPIGSVMADAGITAEELLGMTFLELVVALFDPHT